MKNWLATLIALSLVFTGLAAQGTSIDRIDLHINCNSCDMNYLRQELDYVNHVRDQAMADVQVFVNRIALGSGGGRYEMTFTGKNQYEKIKQALTYTTAGTMTNDEVRKGLLKYMEAGLVTYLMEAGMQDALKLSVEPLQAPEQIKPIQKDPWNYWIFDVRSGANIGKESNQSNVNLEFGFNGERVTEDWRIRHNVGLYYTKRTFNNGDESIVSINKNYYWSGAIVKSLGDHWSAGVFGGLSHNTYNNIDLSYSIRPAVEYNVFPYEEVISRELTFAYKVGYVQNNYIDSTIYNEIQENLFNQSLSMETRFRQPWGDIFSSVVASNFLHDFSKNRVELDSYVSVRVFKGFALRVSTEMDLIRDQISLPAAGVSLEDLLLQQRQVATNFRMRMGLGINYTFGAAFNNIVNTRL
ncbi:MAG: DUF481 domain-containing protein [Saprospiraceae bacterium]